MIWLIELINWVFERSVNQPAEIEAARLRNALLGNDRKVAKSWLHDSHWQ